MYLPYSCYLWSPIVADCWMDTPCVTLWLVTCLDESEVRGQCPHPKTSPCAGRSQELHDRTGGRCWLGSFGSAGSDGVNPGNSTLRDSTNQCKHTLSRYCRPRQRRAESFEWLCHRIWIGVWCPANRTERYYIWIRVCQWSALVYWRV